VCVCEIQKKMTFNRRNPDDAKMPTMYRNDESR
jgi:hypothetical protein